MYCGTRTNVEQHIAVLVVHNVVFKDLVVQGPWWLHGRRHVGWGGTDTNECGSSGEGRGTRMARGEEAQRRRRGIKRAKISAWHLCRRRRANKKLPSRLRRGARGANGLQRNSQRNPSWAPRSTRRGRRAQRDAAIAPWAARRCIGRLSDGRLAAGGRFVAVDGRRPGAGHDVGRAPRTAWWASQGCPASTPPPSAVSPRPRFAAL